MDTSVCFRSSHGVRDCQSNDLQAETALCKFVKSESENISLHNLQQIRKEIAKMKEQNEVLKRILTIFVKN